MPEHPHPQPPPPSIAPHHLRPRPQVYWWHDKYKPRRPKYFNRVHTGARGGWWGRCTPCLHAHSLSCTVLSTRAWCVPAITPLGLVQHGTAASAAPHVAQRHCAPIVLRCAAAAVLTCSP